MKGAVIAVLFLLVTGAAAQDVTCTSSATTVECEDSDGNVTYTICSGEYCTSGTYQMSREMRDAVVNRMGKPMFHRDALCGADDPTGELFPTLHKRADQRVREPLLPKKNCAGAFFVGTYDKGYLKQFEKIVYDMCSSKKLSEQQCGVLAKDIQVQREDQ